MNSSLSYQAGLAASVMLAAATEQMTGGGREVLLDPVLRLLCIGGAMGGGFLAVAAFPVPKAGGRRAYAIRWLFCTIFGGMFGPFIIEQVLPARGYEVTTSSVLAASAFLGLFAWSLVELGHKLLRKKFGESASSTPTDDAGADS